MINYRVSATVLSLLVASSPSVMAQNGPQELPSVVDNGESTDTPQGRPTRGPPEGVRGGPPGGKPVFDDKWIMLGIGGGFSPSYTGSNNYRFFPAPFVQGSYEGFDFGARGPGLYVDVLRDNKSESKTKFVLGPQFRIRSNRTDDIDDPVVELLGEEDTAIEIGFTAGVQFEELLNPFDSLLLSVDAGWDVAGGHDGRVISPSIAYSTPLSRAAFARLGLSADIVDDNYADTYFSVDGPGSLASGLPAFAAEGGVHSIGSNLILGYDLSGNALDGGFSLFAIGNYSRLLNDARRSPVTSIQGDANQWFGAIGVAYTF